MEKALETAIHRTLAWFDIFYYPLTAEELYHNLWEYRPSSFLYFVSQLETLGENSQIETKNGFYFLRGRDNIISARQLAIPHIEKKLHIAKRASKKLRWVPFVRALFVCNTVASGVASQDSDIDVLIVIRSGRMWLTRFLVTSILSLWKLRRHGKKVANRICLSFYVTDDALDMSSIRWGSPDIYLAYWLTQLVPVYDPEDILSTLQKKNTWSTQYIPQGFQPYQVHTHIRVCPHKLSTMVRAFFEKVWHGNYGDLLEQQAKQLQLSKIKRNVKSVQAAEDTRVVVSDTMLKFHEKDRREFYRNEWKKRLS